MNLVPVNSVGEDVKCLDWDELKKTKYQTKTEIYQPLHHASIPNYPPAPVGNRPFVSCFEPHVLITKARLSAKLFI